MSNLVERFSAFCIRQRVLVISVLAILTLIFAIFALRMEVRTVFSDMLPQSHDYVKTHEQYKDTFYIVKN